MGSLTFSVRTERDPVAAMADVRQALQSVDSAVPVNQVETADELMERQSVCAQPQGVPRLTSLKRGWTGYEPTTTRAMLNYLQLDRPASLAAPEAVPEARPDVSGSPRWDSELLPKRVPPGVVEAINGNIEALLRRGRGYKNVRYLLLKAQRMAATRTEFIVVKKGSLNCGSCQIPAQSPYLKLLLDTSF